MIFYIGITIFALAAARMTGIALGQELLPGAGAGRPDLPAEGTRRDALAKVFLCLLFAVLFLPAAMRQATGNDYMRYVEFFHLASIDAYVPTEAGFNALVKFLYRLCGYENYLLVFAVFAAGTVGFFIAAVYRRAQNFFFSFFLFLLFGYYFQSYDTVRYYFALSIVTFALSDFLERRYAAFVLEVLAASLFHRSCLAVLVLYPLAAVSWSLVPALLEAGLGMVLFLFRDFWMSIIVRLYPSYEDSEILAAGGSFSPGNVIRCGLILAAAFALRKAGRLHTGERSPEERELCMELGATWIAFLVYVSGWFIPEVSRICYYLTLPQIFLIPRMIGRVPPGRKRRAAAAAAACAAVIVFAVFLRNADDIRICVLPYHSFLFSDLPETPSRSIQ